MHPRYFNLYKHLIGDISREDLTMLQNAEWQQWEDIAPEKAGCPEVACILKEIAREKSIREEYYI